MLLNFTGTHEEIINQMKEWIGVGSNIDTTRLDNIDATLASLHTRLENIENEDIISAIDIGRNS